MKSNNRDFDNFWLGVALALTASLATYWWWLQRRVPPPASYSPPAPPPPRRVPPKPFSPPTKAPPAAPLTSPSTPSTSQPAQDDLTRIKGIGATYAQRFYQAGIHTFAALAALTPDQIRSTLHLKEWQGQPETWIQQAQEQQRSNQ